MSKIASQRLPTATPKRQKKTAADAMASPQHDMSHRSYNWRRRFLIVRRFVMLLLMASFTYSGWFVWQHGYAAQIGMVTDTLLVEMPTIPTLRVARVEITGMSNITEAEVRRAAGELEGMPILSVPLDVVRANLMALGWVEDATILRSLPGVVHINVTERSPYAIWQHEGTLSLIDRSGAEIKRGDMHGFVNLPLIVGDGAPKEAATLLEVLRSQPELWTRVHAVVRVGGRRWDLKFDNGIEVMLPELGVDDAWTRLASLERLHAILSRDVAVLDLRLSDRLIVRPAQPVSGTKTNKKRT